MNCPSCRLPVEAGAAFCGNCGAQLVSDRTAAAALTQPSTPDYALPLLSQHTLETRALSSLLLGIMGLVGALFMPLLGLGFGLIGIVLGTMSRAGARRGLNTVGIITSSLAIMAGLATWVYVVKHTTAVQTVQDNISATAVSDLSTPCYSLGFVDKLNVTNRPDSCDMNAFNGQTLTSSSDAYKVYANQSTITDVNTFTVVAKRSIHKDVEQNLPGFVVDSERLTQFAGSPAYILNASNKVHNIAVVEAAVLHQVGNGDNIFLLVHARASDSVDLSTLEARWQWK
jgi:hypothetical protein